jgi:hypothetical protein
MRDRDDRLSVSRQHHNQEDYRKRQQALVVRTYLRIRVRRSALEYRFYERVEGSHVVSEWSSGSVISATI